MLQINPHSFLKNIVKYWLFLKDFLILETADLICC